MIVEQIQERRSEVRVEVDEPVAFSSPSVGVQEPLETLSGRTLNLGLGGILIESDRPFPLSTEVEVRIDLDETPLHLTGTVVRVILTRSGKAKLGVEFHELEPWKKARLENLIEDHEPDLAPKFN